MNEDCHHKRNHNNIRPKNPQKFEWSRNEIFRGLGTWKSFNAPLWRPRTRNSMDFSNIEPSTMPLDVGSYSYSFFKSNNHQDQSVRNGILRTRWEPFTEVANTINCQELVKHAKQHPPHWLERKKHLWTRNRLLFSNPKLWQHSSDHSHFLINLTPILRA